MRHGVCRFRKTRSALLIAQVRNRQTDGQTEARSLNGGAFIQRNAR